MNSDDPRPPDDPPAHSEWVTTTTVLERLRAEDTAAWQRFVQRFRAPALGFANAMGLPPDEAEDATQEALNAFMAAFRQGGYDSDKGRLSSWLFGFARRTMLSARRAYMERREKPTNDTGFWRVVPDDENAEDIWNEVWEKEVVTACLEQLEVEIGERNFQAFHALTIEGRDGNEVARELGISRNAVLVAKHRALQRMKQLRSQYEGEA